MSDPILSAKNTQALRDADKDLYKRFFELEQRFAASQESVVMLTARVAGLETSLHQLRASSTGRGPSVR